MYSTNNLIEMDDKTPTLKIRNEMEIELSKLGDITVLKERIANLEYYFNGLIGKEVCGFTFELNTMKRFMQYHLTIVKRHEELTQKLKEIDDELVRYSNLTIEVDASMNTVVMYPPPAPKRFHATVWPNSSTIICTITVEALIVFMVICSVLSAYFIARADIVLY
ncbi:hypothetical protein PGAG_00120 [Phaeocystis globosa virus 12T]|uniref:Uncharacterized protein n=1 Tax=Phaeocystis globosa virus PgV-16T TaxID=3071227 RepID=A0AC59EWZ0_9VIRU|nr:hypothetical protein PGCG_00161 [Phaeocystis globosa virus]AET73009.1 hypothetical protein PGAG_00120 [Phaeocystis globosa virus 12T]AET73831.1 hypothetical protein PGBG_00123 [Phaeocystis globosa virus 14T]AGM15472.1 hypothetical protein PGCG_00161 [Phaeocystis globosa virus PgV-16T]UYE94202.1 hypothetical protein PGV14T_00161 [Phaeocystis globosa virus]